MLDGIRDKHALYVESIKKTYPSLDIDSARRHTDEGQFNTWFCKHDSPDAFILERADLYRMTFAQQKALDGSRNNDEQAFRNGMERYR